MSRFKEDHSKEYDKNIHRFIPGYELVHQLTAAKLKILLPQKADILVIGVGTGTEILEFSKMNDRWRFTAIDLSEDMLNIAKRKFEKEAIGDRVDIHIGDVSSLNSVQKFDAAICLFVMHFIRTFNAKLRFVESIHSMLRYGAPFLFADLMNAESETEKLSQGEICRILGLSDEVVDVMLEKLETDFFPLAFDALEKLIIKAGFKALSPYFQSLRFHAYQCVRI